MIRTGYDHFREAEQHLVYARESGDYPDNERIQLAYAQVHATLALAAANGANRPPAEKPDVRTMSDPPEQGDLVVDQMGDVPEAEIYCGGRTILEDGDYDCMLTDCHEGAHIDAEGREFR